MGKAQVTSGDLFREVVPNSNVITPHLVGYYNNGQYDMELTKGEGMSGTDVFGVTVVNTVTKEHEHDISKMFHSRKEAVNYMNTGVLR